jgi:hypothetical protein
MKTQNEKQLERYFNEVFKPSQLYPAPHIVNAFGENDPRGMKYKDLSDREKEAIANSYGYQAWLLRRGIGNKIAIKSNFFNLHKLRIWNKFQIQIES